MRTKDFSVSYIVLAAVVLFWVFLSKLKKKVGLFFSTVINAYWPKMSQPSLISPVHRRCVQESGVADAPLPYHHCSQSAAVCVPAMAPK